MTAYGMRISDWSSDVCAPDLPQVTFDAVIDGHQSDLRRAGLSIRAIASEMRRAPSTIRRDLKRNTISVRGYMPHTAHRLDRKSVVEGKSGKVRVDSRCRLILTKKK